jgi:hypothetical protein
VAVTSCVTTLVVTGSDHRICATYLFMLFTVNLRRVSLRGNKEFLLNFILKKKFLADPGTGKRFKLGVAMEQTPFKSLGVKKTNLLIRDDRTD